MKCVHFFWSFEMYYTCKMCIVFVHCFCTCFVYNSLGTFYMYIIYVHSFETSFVYTLKIDLVCTFSCPCKVHFQRIYEERIKWTYNDPINTHKSTFNCPVGVTSLIITFVRKFTLCTFHTSFVCILRIYFACTFSCTCILHYQSTNKERIKCTYKKRYKMDYKYFPLQFSTAFRNNFWLANTIFTFLTSFVYTLEMYFACTFSCTCKVHFQRIYKEHELQNILGFIRPCHTVLLYASPHVFVDICVCVSQGDTRHTHTHMYEHMIVG
jgi:hypothetical protein